MENREDRLIVLNDVAKSEAPPGFGRVRIHDLKHTFGRRLRAAGVGEETRKVLLGHKNGDITTHCSGAELAELIAPDRRKQGNAGNYRPAKDG